MRYTHVFLFLIILLIIFAIQCGGVIKEYKIDANIQATEIIISAAASMKEAMGEIADTYRKDNGNVKIIYNFGSSGALQSQIQQGAPVDIFISASPEQIEVLKDKKLTIAESQREFVGNKVVLITAKNSSTMVDSFEALARAKRIALGEPKSVPIGQYSAEIIAGLGLSEIIKDKIVYGSDVRQVLAWVEQGEVEVGVVYKTDVAISKKVKVICEAPEGSHEAVVYYIALIKSSKSDAAKEFMDFLARPIAKDILVKYGFVVK